MRTFIVSYDLANPSLNQPYLAEEERFILLDLGIHVLDVARVFLGEADRLYCQAQSIRPGIRGEDMATMMLHHRSGATSVVDCSYASRLDPDPFPETLLHLEGTRGSLVLARGLDRGSLVLWFSESPEFVNRTVQAVTGGCYLGDVETSYRCLAANLPPRYAWAR